MDKLYDEEIEAICRNCANAANRHNDNDWSLEAEDIAINAARTAVYEVLGIEEFDGNKFIYKQSYKDTNHE